MAELRIEGLTKRFGDFAAVKDVSLVVPDREFMVLLGPSGCGKSTLLRSVAGLEVIDEGRIFIAGEDVSGKAPRERGISMVFQSYAVFPHLTVFSNIAFGLRRQKRPKEEVKRRVQEAAELLHIEDLLDRHPAALSGGQRQRVAVARALAYEAKILLMDEPLSNLDALLRIEMRAELKRLINEIDATVVYVTHDQVEAMSMGDRIAVMLEGEILQVGTPMSVYRDPINRFVGGFIGSPPMNFIDAEVTQGGTAVTVGDTVLPLRAPESAADTVVMGIRAEDIDVLDAPTEESIPAAVLVAEPLGSHNLLTVRAAGDIVKVTTPADRHLAAEQDVWLTFASEKVTWLDPATGIALH